MASPTTPTWKQRAARPWYVLRYYRVSQMAMRLAARSRHWWTRLTGARRSIRSPAGPLKRRRNAALEQLAGDALAARRDRGSAENAARILQGRYRLLNVERALPDPLDWRLGEWPEAARLWRFHLHYHEFLLDLAAEGLARGEPAWLQRAWHLVTGWIDGSHPGDADALPDAWHPYCISRRLPVWILLWSACPPDDEAHDRVLASIFSQASFLQRNLEWDVRGNHLLENARALALVGAFLDGPSANRWLQTGARILRRELAEQILPHGEHFERSPMYHAQMLEAVLDVRDAVGAFMPELAEVCEETAVRMAGFLQSILHPDGGLPLLGDTCLSEARAPVDLVRRATAANLPNVRGDRNAACASVVSASAGIVGDCWVYRRGRDFVIFDAGPVGPDHLPAHAHADLLAFEASLGGRRLFVDSGVFNYEDDAMRRYCRSSAAHNVLQIDGHDQCDMWSRFRMGYRGWPTGLECGQTHGFHWARAAHNAYRRLGAPKLGRWLACRPHGPWICVDWALGKGRHELTSWLHLHPDAHAEKLSDREVRISIDADVLRLCYLTPGRISLSTGWYCPEFGRRLQSPVVQWTAEESLPSICGWYLVWGDKEGRATLDHTASGRVRVRWSDGDEESQLDPVEESVFVQPMDRNQQAPAEPPA